MPEEKKDILVAKTLSNRQVGFLLAAVISITATVTGVLFRFELGEQVSAAEKILNAEMHKQTNIRIDKKTGRNLERIKANEKAIAELNKNHGE